MAVQELVPLDLLHKARNKCRERYCCPLPDALAQLRSTTPPHQHKRLQRDRSHHERLLFCNLRVFDDKRRYQEQGITIVPAQPDSLAIANNIMNAIVITTIVVTSISPATAIPRPIQSIQLPKPKTRVRLHLEASLPAGPKPATFELLQLQRRQRPKLDRLLMIVKLLKLPLGEPITRPAVVKSNCGDHASRKA